MRLIHFILYQRLRSVNHMEKKTPANASFISSDSQIQQLEVFLIIEFNMRDPEGQLFLPAR